MSEEALKAEAAKLHQQRVLDALCASFPYPLNGTEDAHARKRWANLVNARLKVWPFATIGVAPLFDVALKGRAWNEFQQFPRANEAETDQAFSARVVQHFLNPPKLKTTEVADFMKRLQLQKIKSGDNLEDVFYALQKEISRLNWEGDAANDLLIGTFVGMLPADAQLVIKARDKITPQLALEIAQRTMKDKDPSVEKEPSAWSLLAQLTSSYEPDAVAQTAGAVAAVPEPSISTKDVQSIVERSMSAHSAKVDELTASLQALTKAFQSSTQQQDRENSGKGKQNKGQLNSIQNDGRNQREPCQICGKTNHRADKCWKRGDSNATPNTGSLNPPTTVCQLCDSPGHIAKDCNVRRPITCYRCGQMGHRSRDCSLPPPTSYQRGGYQPRQGRFSQASGARQPMQPANQGASFYNAPPHNVPQGTSFFHSPPYQGNNWGNNGTNWGNR